MRDGDRPRYDAWHVLDNRVFNLDMATRFLLLFTGNGIIVVPASAELTSVTNAFASA